MRIEGIFSRADGKFEAWVRVPGGLECKGVFDDHSTACTEWVKGQPNDGVRRAFSFDSIPTYTEQHLELVPTPISLLRGKVRGLINAYGMKNLLEEIIYHASLGGEPKERYLSELVCDLEKTHANYTKRYDR